MAFAQALTLFSGWTIGKSKKNLRWTNQNVHFNLIAHIQWYECKPYSSYFYHAGDMVGNMDDEGALYWEELYKTINNGPYSISFLGMNFEEWFVNL